VPGDPVAGEGWYEGPGWPGGEWPSDRRFLMSSGPFTMAPGDTQEVVLAIIMAQGEDHIDSITELKKVTKSVQIAYDSDFKTAPAMSKPSIKAVRHDQSLTLYWEPNAENYNRVDPLLKHQVLIDTTYTFEGYRVWQFRDLEGTDPQVIATYDKMNNVDVIYEWKIIDGFPYYVPAITGANEGIRRSHVITENCYDEKPLNNANPYYFAVTAYAHSEHSDPAYVESKPEIIEVIPGIQKIDDNVVYDSGDKIIADHIFGDGDGQVDVTVFDPYALTGDEYRVIFKGEERDIAYSFINYTTNDTLISDCTYFYIDTVGAAIFDGFMLNIHNLGLEQIPYYRNYAVNQILEVNGPGGVEPETPIDVYEQYNSTKSWQISTYGIEPDPIENIDINDQIGYSGYEIRFTESGSEYYTTGSSPGFQPWLQSDPKTADRVPFKIWDLGMTDSEEDNFRLTVKILDDFNTLIGDSIRVNQDGKWSQLGNSDWEPIFAFFMDSSYQEVLPNTSGPIVRADSRLGRIIIKGDLPAEGTVIRITTWKPLSEKDVFSVIAAAPDTKDYITAKTNLDKISVFPNPYFGGAMFSGYLNQDFIRFTNLPTQATLRIFSLAGIYVRRIEKNNDNPWLDWDLKNNSGEQVASGVYIAHLEMPNIGEKVMKLAVILENQR
jgi:hypothetical protein